MTREAVESILTLMEDYIYVGGVNKCYIPDCKILPVHILKRGENLVPVCDECIEHLQQPYKRMERRLGYAVKIKKPRPKPGLYLVGVA